MHICIRVVLGAWLTSGTLGVGVAATAPASVDVYARATSQAIDQAYTAQIAQFTTDPAFHSAADQIPAGIRYRCRPAKGARAYCRRPELPAYPANS